MTFSSHLIRVIDLEATGFPPDAAPIEIGAVDVSAGDLQPTTLSIFGSDLIHTERAIPPEASAVHHIVADDILGAPTWENVLPRYLQMGEPDVFAAHNAKFERAFITDALTGGRPWICTWKCALRLWPDAPGHSNQVLRYWRNPPGLERDVAYLAHRALPDAYVTAHLLVAMLEQASVEQLIAWSAEPALLARIPFGDFRGSPWSACDVGFLHWVLRRDFDEDLLFTARHELQRREADAQPSANDAVEDAEADA